MNEDAPRFEKLRHNKLSHNPHRHNHAPIEGMSAGRPVVPQPKHSNMRLNDAHRKRRRRFR